jgi:TonB family protein
VTTGTHELTRFRPLGRGTFVGGFFMTLLIHAGLGGLVWYGNVKDPPREEAPRDILVTQMVQLGKPREKFWLPRIVQPPAPKIVEPTIKVADDPNAKPVEREKEKPKPEKPEISKSVQDVLNRRRALLQNAVEEPPEGSLTGSSAGTATQASEGDEYATQIYEAIRRNWNVPTGLSIGEVITLEAEIRISISDDGTILEPKLRKPSGNGLFDDSCLQAVQATRKVPPPPAAQRARYRRGVALAFGGKDLAR